MHKKESELEGDNGDEKAGSVGGGEGEQEEEEEEPDPRQTQSWKNWGTVDPALVVPGGRARKRTKASSEFMVEDFKD